MLLQSLFLLLSSRATNIVVISKVVAYCEERLPYRWLLGRNFSPRLLYIQHLAVKVLILTYYVDV